MRCNAGNDRGMCFKTGKCREKCAKRKRCRFYTTFSNGWCQLSTRCSTRDKAGDQGAVTFIKES